MRAPARPANAAPAPRSFRWMKRSPSPARRTWTCWRSTTLWRDSPKSTSARAGWSSFASSPGLRSRRRPRCYRCPSRLPSATGSPRRPGFRGRFAGSRPMQPDRWQRIKEVLDVALRLEVSERDEYLVRSCEGDADLREEVQSLIDAYEEDGDTLEPARPEPPADPLIGTNVGTY